MLVTHHFRCRGMSRMPELKKNSLLIVFCLFLFAGIEFLIMGQCPVNGTCPDNRRERVGFPHERHMAVYDCLDCHHVYDEQKNNVLDSAELYDGNPEIKCSFCHTPDSAIASARAFHRSCIRCHNQKDMPGHATGPNMCGECHRRDGSVPADYEMIIGG